MKRNELIICAVVVVFLAILFGLTGCGRDPLPPIDQRLQTKTVEGCEYLYAESWHNTYYGYSVPVFMLTHKGNCSNPIHSHNVAPTQGR